MLFNMLQSLNKSIHGTSYIYISEMRQKNQKKIEQLIKEENKNDPING